MKSRPGLQPLTSVGLTILLRSAETNRNTVTLRACGSPAAAAGTAAPKKGQIARTGDRSAARRLGVLLAAVEHGICTLLH